ncbi:MAG: hypothetical protein HQ478_15795 [Chloroflexi bacterium]|nr:hypothetical protein [Chloroflexota bacterium]
MKTRHLPTAFVFLVFVFGMAALSVLNDAADVSTLERRELSQSPSVSFERVVDGDFTEDYAEFLQDQMVFRDEFRFAKSFVERQVLRRSENNGVYVVGDRIYDKFYGIEDHFIDRAARLINEITKDTRSANVLLSIIPTKAQMLDRNKYLLSDQNELADTLKENTEAVYVDLMGLAKAGNERFYYASDPHWTTQGAIAAYEILAGALGFQPVRDYEFEAVTDSFVGSDWGKAASWSIDKDTIYLAHNDLLDGMSACRFESPETSTCIDSVYFRDRGDDLDPYDVFLGGLSPIIAIENPLAETDRELVIFKDSYAHSLAPFLAQHFKTVTLFDLRFVRRQFILDNFDLSQKDVLFLYGTSVLNTDPQILN